MKLTRKEFVKWCRETPKEPAGTKCRCPLEVFRGRDADTQDFVTTPAWGQKLMKAVDIMGASACAGETTWESITRADCLRILGEKP